jgi:hypothetical protein
MGGGRGGRKEGRGGRKEGRGKEKLVAADCCSSVNESSGYNDTVGFLPLVYKHGPQIRTVLIGSHTSPTRYHKPYDQEVKVPLTSKREGICDTYLPFPCTQSGRQWKIAMKRAPYSSAKNVLNLGTKTDSESRQWRRLANSSLL